MDGADVESPDIDVCLNAELDISFAVDDSSLAHLASPPETESSNSKPSGDSPDSDRPYHSKRPHKKSRAGCRQCKKRKVKCDETRPTCKACRLRKEKCIYPATSASASAALSTTLVSRTTPISNSSSPISSPRPSFNPDPSTIVISEPLFRPREMTDALDMKMLWFYTSRGYQFFSIQTGRSPAVDHVLQVKVVQHAFESPFLMDCLMAVSSLHLQSMKQPVPAQRTAAYCYRAFQGYRNAIEAANPSDFPALIACSLLMVAVSSQPFRDPDAKPLYVVDWMHVWRGISLIFEIVTPRVLQESGMAMLFYRPPVDLEKAAAYIPNNLLFMVASIKPGDTDDEHQQTYYDMLKCLGSLYQEVKEHGFSPILDLRIVTFLTFVPKAFIPLAKEHRPRALVLLAYYLAFSKITRGVWWVDGIANREIGHICKSVGEEWAHLLRVPQMVLRTEDKVEIAQLIINNRNWTPAEMDRYEQDRDPRLLTDLRLFDNQGSEIDISQGEWMIKTSTPMSGHSNTNIPKYLDPYPELSSSVAEILSNP
ncbi:hypothetical protein F5Y00DRAFT_163259 [Daldinia vernicosa]|uniref:uncharacterized protein n=1 Tax=Daldinia vernicosa TaxID=114800 RepID=UPI002007E9F5|nr:uncharacterized protein F5Y00DRAFT_163259 [Daldinia vernicosa]KAI0845789.1 hypothetical protein F5Y00DRAFT_163259 [Daldinia vernicosa]